MIFRLFKLLLIIGIFVSFESHSQGFLRSIEIENVSSAGTQARRYEIARVVHNSHNGHVGGAIIVELFHKYFATGYEKYSVECGFGQGTTGTLPIVRHLESYGGMHTARVRLGESIDMGTLYSGRPNVELPIYVDVKGYTEYNVKISFMQEVVDSLTGVNQIQIKGNSSAIDIPDFVTLVAPFNISSNGNVGIQTVNPQRGLHIGSVVLGSAADSSADLISTGGIIIGRGKSLSLDQSYKTHAFIEYSPRISAETRFIHQGYYGHAFTVRNNVPALSILGNNGNVGISTTQPLEKLQIGNSYYFHDGGHKVIGFMFKAGGHQDMSPTHYSSEIRFDPANGDLRFGTSSSLTNSPITRLTINKAGAVGIGAVLIPSDFKLAVAGKTLTEKVIVRRQENWNWPDFVFEESYELPRLLDIEKFVEINHHLPEMPSAKEIEKDGLDLDEMNRLLLKKVEEVTLYLFEHQKEIEKLKLELKELKNK